mmetsp:Transcript_48903/g.114441  ORF Transcript_48903/g.114441 Transcript_48903/m.114441 type:complete len:119 (+) Transcript_48903:1274-1630(+)
MIPVLSEQPLDDLSGIRGDGCFQFCQPSKYIHVQFCQLTRQNKNQLSLFLMAHDNLHARVKMNNSGLIAQGSTALEIMVGLTADLHLVASLHEVLGSGAVSKVPCGFQETHAPTAEIQ